MFDYDCELRCYHPRLLEADDIDPDARVLDAGAGTSSIRPPEDSRDCFSDFAVTLYVDHAGHVEWLDFALSGL